MTFELARVGSNYTSMQPMSARRPAQIKYREMLLFDMSLINIFHLLQRIV